MTAIGWDDGGKPTSVNAGCWIDGHWGQYGVTRLIGIAESFGFSVDSEGRECIERYCAGYAYAYVDDFTFDTLDVVVSVADDAEEWMNDNIAPDGFSFGWHDGEFFLQSAEWWEETA